MPSRSIVPVVTWRAEAMAWCAGSTAASGDRLVCWSQAGKGPVQLGDLRARAPGGVPFAGLGEQLVAGLVEAVGEVEAGGAFGGERPVPGPLATGDLATGGVEGQDAGAEVADRPGPLGLEQPHEVQEVLRCVRGPFGQPPGHLVQFGHEAVALVDVGRRLGLPGESEPAQHAARGAHVDARHCRQQQRHRRRGVPVQVRRIAEDRGDERAGDVRMQERGRVVGVAVGGDRLAGAGGAPRRGACPPATGDCRSTGRSARYRYGARRLVPPRSPPTQTSSDGAQSSRSGTTGWKV